MATELVQAIPIATTVDNVIEAEAAIPVFPPRPDAIVTLVTSADQLRGAQTLFYSVKKNQTADPKYAPEFVTLVTSNVSIDLASDSLVPDFCTRIIPVESISFPSDAEQDVVPKIHSITSSSGRDTINTLTLLNLFSFSQYDTVVYIGVNCLVVKDIFPLLDLGKIFTISDALIAAAPGMIPPDKFNTGVMVIRPNRGVHKELMDQRSELVSGDGSINGYLNAYFKNWYRDMPPMARLGIEYNAQRALYDITKVEHVANHTGGGDDLSSSSFWEVNIAPKLRIIQFSGGSRPWDNIAPDSDAGSGHPLVNLWRNWYRKSQNYHLRMVKERKDEDKRKLQQLEEDYRKRAAAAARATSSSGPSPPSIPGRGPNVHKLISRRFKELRAQGLSTKDAMDQAQDQYQDQQNTLDAGSQVAAMFGMG